MYILYIVLIVSVCKGSIPCTDNSDINITYTSDPVVILSNITVGIFYNDHCYEANDTIPYGIAYSTVSMSVRSDYITDFGFGFTASDPDNDYEQKFFDKILTKPWIYTSYYFYSAYYEQEQIRGLPKIPKRITMNIFMYNDTIRYSVGKYYLQTLCGRGAVEFKGRCIPLGAIIACSVIGFVVVVSIAVPTTVYCVRKRARRRREMREWDRHYHAQQNKADNDVVKSPANQPEIEVIKCPTDHLESN